MAARYRANGGLALVLTATAMAAIEACGTSAPSSVFQQDLGAIDGGGASRGSVGNVASGDASQVDLGGGDAGAHGPGLQGAAVSLAFQPPSATIWVEGGATATAQFTLIATDARGNTAPVAPVSLAFDRPDLASASGGLPVTITAPGSTTPYAGVGAIHAVYGALEATATVTVKVHGVAFGSGLTATSPAVIALTGGAADAGAGPGATGPDGGALDAAAGDGGQGQGNGLPRDPTPGIAPLLYPYDGTVFPLGLTSPLIMWNAPQAGDVYRLHFAEKNYSFDAYATLSSLPAQMRLDQTAWDRLTASNDAKNGPDPLTFTLSRWDAKTGKAYASASETWTIAPESLRGAIYYWTASQESAQAARIGHISRFQPGTGAKPQPLNGGICMGCHAVNAQGTVLVADIDDNLEGKRPDGGGVPSVAPYDNWSGTRAWASFDVTTPDAPLLYQSNKFGADVALTPDGRYLVFGGPTAVPGSKYLSLGDPRTGEVLAHSGLDDIVLDPNETNLEMPAFSPDGTKLAVVESANGGDRDNVLPGQPEVISYMTFDEAADGGPVFDPTLHPVVAGTSPALASAGPGLGYPSFTPDSKAIAFHAGTWSTGCATGCLDNDVDDGDLFLVTLDGGAPIRLAAADDPPDPNDRFASVEPTFNPVVRGGYSWVVFTSMRNWGNMPWPRDGSIPADAGPDMHVNGKRRLWVAAVDTRLGATDPSHPAIYLEGQEDTPNMRGFWTLASCVATPGTGIGADAGAEAGSSPGADAGGSAGACSNGFECCSGFCQAGVCVDVSQIACVAVGAACGADKPCCNAGVVQCVSGTCAIPTAR